MLQWGYEGADGWIKPDAPNAEEAQQHLRRAAQLLRGAPLGAYTQEALRDLQFLRELLTPAQHSTAGPLSFHMQNWELDYSAMFPLLSSRRLELAMSSAHQAMRAVQQQVKRVQQGGVLAATGSAPAASGHEGLQLVRQLVRQLAGCMEALDGRWAEWEQFMAQVARMYKYMHKQEVDDE